MEKIKLSQIFNIPNGLLKITDVKQIHKIFKNPTILHLEGENKKPIFISVLLHANEDTSLLAVIELLKRYKGKILPRSLSIFFANIEASKTASRFIKGQQDYNRVWPGTNLAPSAETFLMQNVFEIIEKKQPFASIDIHNNTGKNPHYGCINTLQNKFINLAALFSDTVVFFKTPVGVQSAAMAKICPSVTIECGLPHLKNGVKHATDFLDCVLNLDKITNEQPSKVVEIYHTVARVIVAKKTKFTFVQDIFSQNCVSDICFFQGIDRLNFSKIQKDFKFACVKDKDLSIIEVFNEQQQKVTEDFFQIKDNYLLFKKSLMPAMISQNKQIIKQDCLCYLMEQIT